jgi:hypothetical protein
MHCWPQCYMEVTRVLSSGLFNLGKNSGCHWTGGRVIPRPVWRKEKENPGSYREFHPTLIHFTGFTVLVHTQQQFRNSNDGRLLDFLHHACCVCSTFRMTPLPRSSGWLNCCGVKFYKWYVVKSACNQISCVFQHRFFLPWSSVLYSASYSLPSPVIWRFFLDVTSQSILKWQGSKLWAVLRWPRTGPPRGLLWTLALHENG